MNDQQIRSALKSDVLNLYADPDTLIVDELSLNHGLTRVDVASINGHIHGYEIKSCKDTLDRLPEQARIYSLFLDHATLVVTPRHADDAIDIVPEWWGIELAVETIDGQIVFENIRPASPNPNLDIKSVLSLLWRNEALAILEDLGEAKGFRSKSCSVLYQRLAEVADADYLCLKVRHCLLNRKDWKSAERSA